MGGGRRTKRFHNTYYDIISIENLLISWQEFLRNKLKRKDIAEFSLHLPDHIISLYRELIDKTYCHGPYWAFKINDPKSRDIHKATVRDRLVHHAVHRILYPYFDQKFIHDSYSCRHDKGTHRAINRFRDLARRVSHNHTRTVWVLKCDIRKFFASINHEVLKKILRRSFGDSDIFWLLTKLVDSFYTKEKIETGLPIGNLTSQLFVNIYMNEFDQFVKRILKVANYVRYADDFVVIHENKIYLENVVRQMSEFLESSLKLSLHPDKVFIKTLASGVDFLGWVHFSHHRVLRTTTKRRMLKKVRQNRKKETIASYLGLLSHGDTIKLREQLRREQ